jgi:peptidoglycan/LPS O-acetylase OafA/YrhL
LRIFPQYFFILALTVVFVSFSGFFEINYSVLNIFSSLTIFPLNWTRVIEAQTFIAPAWSLAVELKAYLLLPFVIFFKSVKVSLSAISMVIFLVASFGFIDTDLYTVNTIFGTLFIFILGTSIYNVNTRKNKKPDFFDLYFPVIAYVLMLLLMIVLGVVYREMIFIENVMEIAVGVMIGLPVITYIANSNIKIPFNSLFGDLSYGLFLSHFLVINIINHYSGITFSYGINESNAHISPYLYVISVFLLSVIISLIALYLVERPIKKYRFHLTKDLKRT